MKMRRLAFVAALALLAACGTPRPRTTGEQLKVGLIPVGTTDPYWQAIHAGASQEAARERVELLWPTAFPVGNVDLQLRAIEDALRRGAKALAIAPIDDRRVHARVASLLRAGTRVVIVDTPLTEGAWPFIGSDNYEAGRAAGEHMAQVLGGRGRVIVMNTTPPAVSVTARVKGFLAALAQHPEMSLAIEQPTGAGLEDAFVASHQVLDATGARQPGRVAGVFTPTQSTTVGMVRAIQNLRLTHNIVHVGFDTSPLLANLLNRRALDSLVVQDPHAMGRFAVMSLKRLLTGEEIQLRMVTRTMLATPDNANDPDILSLLKPNLTIVHQ